MLLLFFAAIVILFSYFLLILFYKSGFLKYPSYQTLQKDAAAISATILIPFRNPQPQIHSLLRQIDQQLKTCKNIQVILVNDFSDEEIEFASDLNYQIVSLNQFRSDLSSIKNNKKEAIALGVELSKNEYIICLDSDVSLSESWWHVISNFIQERQPKFAAGLHRYNIEYSWLNSFLTLEQDILTASSIAALQLKIPTMGNGANMIFSKSAFMTVRGYEGLYHTNGGDDIFLYHRIYKSFPYETFYIKNMYAAVYSNAPKSILELLDQRSRWISKTSYYENHWINLQAGLIFMMNFVCLLALFVWTLWPVIILKLFIDLNFINQFQEFYKINTSLLDKLKFIFLYPIYILIVILQTIYKSIFKV